MRAARVDRCGCAGLNGLIRSAGEGRQTLGAVELVLRQRSRQVANVLLGWF